MADFLRFAWSDSSKNTKETPSSTRYAMVYECLLPLVGIVGGILARHSIGNFGLAITLACK